jgi:exosome complex component RRP41
MDGDLTQEEFTKGVNMAVDGCKKVYQVQRDALKRRYQTRALDVPVEAVHVAPQQGGA